MPSALPLQPQAACRLGAALLALALGLSGCWGRSARYAEEPWPSPGPSTGPVAPGSWPEEPPLAELDEPRLKAFITLQNPRLGGDLVSLEALAILREGQRQGVAPNLLAALIATESSFNPRAISPVGAQGLGQLMPPTAKDMGVQDAFDPEQNIAGTAKYLAWLGHWWRADPKRWSLALASYLAGVGTIQQRLRRGQGPTEEQRAYVLRISGFAARLARP